MHRNVLRLSWSLQTKYHHRRWPHLVQRKYFSTAHPSPGSSSWFPQLREEMLQRDVSCLAEDITLQHENRLNQTLSLFLPSRWCRAPSARKPVLPVGHHLIWFNPSLPSEKLLPDGTDELHSPGKPWMRRLWAGGSIQIKPHIYYDSNHGFTISNQILGVEQIKDVQLHERNEDAKLFVKIERRYARYDHLHASHKQSRGEVENSTSINIHKYFAQQLRDDVDWGDAMLKDERTLVFLREPKTVEATPTKYLNTFIVPDFEHRLTPDSSLLFRYSALTFNAHRIHIDRDYARNVEGHPNLLVQGPLLITFMLQAITNHLNTDGLQVLKAIDYRNLAPLYCDEELRICGAVKRSFPDGNLYEVWIEGPTGGVAVRSTMRTVRRTLKRPLGATRWGETGLSHEMMGLEDWLQARALIKPAGSSTGCVRSQALQTSQSHETIPTAPSQRHFNEQRTTSEPSGTRNKIGKELSNRRLQSLIPMAELRTGQSGIMFSKPFHEMGLEPQTMMNIKEVVERTRLESSTTKNNEVQHNSLPVAASPFKSPQQANTHQFIHLSPPSPPRQVIAPPQPLQPVMAPASRELLRRQARLDKRSTSKPVPLVRPYGAKPYERDADLTTSKHSRFLREGPRGIEKLRIRRTAEGKRPLNWKLRGKHSRRS